MFKRKNKTAKKEATDDDGATRLERMLRRPGNTAFKQQRLKAWQPILTPKTVLPTFFVIALLFAPIGGLLLWGSTQVKEFTLDYTRCEEQTPGVVSDMPSSKFSYHGFSSSASPATWEYIDNSATETNVSIARLCRLTFNVPSKMDSPVFMYYKLSNYYQNHRRYVRSQNTDQLKGKAKSYNDIQGGDCKPLDVLSGKPIYPCGLIANSFFNDSYTKPVLLNPAGGGANQTYNMTESGIVWSGERAKYQTTRYRADQIVPPPFWAVRYPNGYQDGQIFDAHQDEHFMVWMRTAGLPTFRKLWQRNPDEDMVAGQYTIDAYLNYPVREYSGTKSIVFSTVSWIGGRNPFLGIAYIVIAGLCVLIGVALLLRHIIKPRKLGDMTYLSWNRDQAPGQPAVR